MAIYHFSGQMITRSKGQSAVASASYRSGEKLTDERTGELKYYVREVQPETMILAPSHAPEWVQDRNRLWNEVEKSETRKNSQLAREFNIALPRELSNDQQKELIKNFVQNEFVNRGMVADLAIHRDDKENPHAHVMLTTREISEEGFTVKNRDWNDRELLNQWREQWANYANKELEKIGVEKISHLSHEARGLEQLPTIHLGHVASAIEKDGKESDRGNINREIKKHNAMIIELQKYREEKEQIQKQISQDKQQKDFLSPSEKIDIKEAAKVVKGYVTLETIEERRNKLNNYTQSLSKSNSYYEWKEKTFNQAKIHINKLDNIENQIQTYKTELKNINWLNPFKIKENNQTKERCEKGIERLEKDSSLHEQKLNYYRGKLDFSTKNEFFSKAKQFNAEKEQIVSKNYKAKVMIEQQRTILDKAEKAIKQGEIREIISHYPDLKNASEFITYENALKLKEINQKAGKIVPIKQIKTEIKERNNKIQDRRKALDRFKNEKQKLTTAETYFKQLESVEQKIKKVEDNPFLKGKLMFSKEARNEHEQAKAMRDQYQSVLKKYGFENRESFEKHKTKIVKAEKLAPQIEKEIRDYQEGNMKKHNGISLGLLEGAIQGIEQAQQKEERVRKRQAEKQRYRGQKQHELEMEM